MGPNFFVWVFLLSAGSADKIITGFVRKDYTVRPGGTSGEIPKSNDDAPCVTLLLDVASSKQMKQTDALLVVKHDLCTIIDREKIKIFGYVVAPNGNCQCGPSNIALSKDEPKKLIVTPVAPKKTEPTPLKLIQGEKT